MKTVFGLTPDLDTTESILVRYISGFFCMQDAIDIGTKLRNRVLNSSVELRIGNRMASVEDIKNLLKFPKDKHGLVYSDIDPKDRQNFGSLEKIMHDRVISMLQTEIVNSEATVIYLKICKQIISSLTDKDMDPIDRIYKMWNAVYFLRCWRKSISIRKDLKITENFITTNAYHCIETNAHTLIEMIVKLRSLEEHNLFMPNLFNSQPCEHTFRQLRSILQNTDPILYIINDFFF